MLPSQPAITWTLAGRTDDSFPRQEPYYVPSQLPVHDRILRATHFSERWINDGMNG